MCLPKDYAHAEEFTGCSYLGFAVCLHFCFLVFYTKAANNINSGPDYAVAPSAEC